MEVNQGVKKGRVGRMCRASVKALVSGVHVSRAPRAAVARRAAWLCSGAVVKLGTGAPAVTCRQALQYDRAGGGACVGKARVGRT